MLQTSYQLNYHKTILYLFTEQLNEDKTAQAYFQ